MAAVTLVASWLVQRPSDWPQYRYNERRSGDQPAASALSNPVRVPSLAVRWSWQPPVSPGAFYSSPVVYGNRVFVGNGNGHFYALDAATGALAWQYPPAGGAALTSLYLSNPSSYGIASSAAIARIRGRAAVIFGAPDRSIGAGLGSGRLFALDAATGSEIWKSAEVARLTGTSHGSTAELHEQIGYSAPLVFFNRVYIGVADHGDNPIQKGRVVAVDVATGAIEPAFSFSATGTRGGGVWSSLAGHGDGIFVTTGNTRCWNGGCQPEPAPNHGLSMLRLDKHTGALAWKLQPVPFALDDDPDWSAGAMVMTGTCGQLVASVQKDGWAYAVLAGSAAPKPPPVRWQFPPTGYPFTPAPGISHGDTHYKKPGATWKDVLFIVTGGHSRPLDGASSGYGKLHALNACAPDARRVRWILDVPGATHSGYSLGPPSVTGGIVYIGTDLGHVVAIADPDVSAPPASAQRCENTHYTLAQCSAAGYHPVPIPNVLADVALPLGAGDGVWTEPALAGGRVFVTTRGGHVYMLSP